MAEERRILGILEPDPYDAPMQPSLNQMFATPGDGGFEADGLTNYHLEAEKKEITLDMAQFILDLTGMVEPTPFSDGTNALISLARGNWLDAAISSVSMLPYLGDIAKIGKFPKYLKSIRKAIKIAEKDRMWHLALTKLLDPLRKLIDQLVEVFGDKLPPELWQIKRDIDWFMPSSMNGAMPGGIINPRPHLSVAHQPKIPRVSKPKGGGTIGDGAKSVDDVAEVGVKNTDGLGRVDGSFSAINPGPLPNNIADTFAGGKYQVVTLEKDTIMSRAGTANQPLGQFFDLDTPASVVQTRIDKAILPVWPGGAKSPIDTAFEVKIPSGTKVYVGEVGSQGGAFVGGTQQIVVPKPWTIDGVEVINSSPIK